MINHTNSLARRISSLITVAGLVGVVAAGCNEYRQAPLVRSVPVALLRPQDPKTVEWSIETALAKRHWKVNEHTGPRYVAQFSERSFSVTIAIVYNGAGARIDYVDSSNLFYEKGPKGEVIHRKYATWVKNLGEEIKIAAAQSGPPPGPTTAVSAVTPPPPAPTAAPPAPIPAPSPAPTPAPR
jgi:hypothetical protein